MFQPVERHEIYQIKNLDLKISTNLKTPHRSYH